MIDVYNEDGKIDWAAVRDAGHSGAICKATEGISLIDARLAENLAGMKDAGMVRGAYHYFHVCNDDVQQADHFVNALRDAGYDFAADLPPAIDLEDPNANKWGMTNVVQSVARFLGVVEGVTGRRCIIYAGKYWAEPYLGDAFIGHPLWLAQYSSAVTPNLPHGWDSYAIWQYSEKGYVTGDSNAGGVDLDRFCGSEAELRAWAATGVLDAATPGPATPGME